MGAGDLLVDPRDDGDDEEGDAAACVDEWTPPAVVDAFEAGAEPVVEMAASILADDVDVVASVAREAMAVESWSCGRSEVMQWTSSAMLTSVHRDQGAQRLEGGAADVQSTLLHLILYSDVSSRRAVELMCSTMNRTSSRQPASVEAACRQRSSRSIEQHASLRSAGLDPLNLRSFPWSSFFSNIPWKVLLQSSVSAIALPMKHSARTTPTRHSEISSTVTMDRKTVTAAVRPTAPWAVMNMLDMAVEIVKTPAKLEHKRRRSKILSVTRPWRIGPTERHKSGP